MDNLWPLVENNIWPVNDLHGVMGIVSDLMRGCGWHTFSRASYSCGSTICRTNWSCHCTTSVISICTT